MEPTDRTPPRRKHAEPSGSRNGLRLLTGDEPAVARARGGVWAADVQRRRLLAGSDVLAVVAAVFALGGPLSLSLRSLVVYVALAVLAMALGKALTLYDRDHRVLWHSTADELPSIVVFALAATAAVAAVGAATDDASIQAINPIAFAAAFALLDVGLRATVRRIWQQTTPAERLLVIGSGAVERAAARKLEIFGDLPIEVLPALTEQEAFGNDFSGLRALAGSVDRILLASSSIEELEIAQLVAFCRRERIKFGVIPPARGLFGTAVILDHLADLPMVQYNTWDVSRSTLVIKRIVDVVVSAGTIAVSAIAFPVVALAIKLDSPGPVFFRQRRGGRHGAPFMMLKFRTMHSDAEARLAEILDVDTLTDPVFKLADDPRVTRVGRLLRRTSLDELPQVYNVLRGDMSIVGPRPEQMDLVERYSVDARAVRLAVKPGLTGPMQIYGRGSLTFEERLSVEREYVEHLSIGRDIRIIGRTLSAVFRGRGAY